MNQGPRFNPYNHGHRSQYAQPLNYLVPQQRPLQQNFNYPAPQRHPFQQIPQPFHNQSENDDRSWIERAVVYKAVTQNQQPYNTHRAFTPNQQAYQPYNQQRVHKVQENYQRVPQAHAYSRAHAPYSRAPFGHPPISVNQNHSNYPRAINPPQAFKALAQSNQRSSANNALRNFQPVFINPETASYGHQINHFVPLKTSVSPGFNQGFVTQIIPAQHYSQPYAQPYSQPYAQDFKERINYWCNQGSEYCTKFWSKGKSVDKSDAKIKRIMLLRNNFEKICRFLKHQETKTPSSDTLTSAQIELWNRAFQTIYDDPDYPKAMQSTNNLTAEEEKPSTNPSSKEAQALINAKLERQYSEMCKEF